MNASLATSSITLDQALAVLADHRYRLTGPRRKVLEAILSHDKPFSAEDIVLESPGTGRATVYRTLEILASVDLLTRLLNPDGHPTYVTGWPGHRHHLICTGCGGVVAFTDCPVDDLVLALSQETRFQIEGHHLEVIGKCPVCQDRNGD